MISHLKARLAATAVTLMIALHSAASHAQSRPAPAPKVGAIETQMPHISVQTVGKGTPVIGSAGRIAAT